MDMEVFVKEIINDIPANFDELVVRINRKTLPSFFVIIHFTLVALSLRQRTGYHHFKFRKFYIFRILESLFLAKKTLKVFVLYIEI